MIENAGEERYQSDKLICLRDLFLGEELFKITSSSEFFATLKCDRYCHRTCHPNNVTNFFCGLSDHKARLELVQVELIQMLGKENSKITFPESSVMNVQSFDSIAMYIANKQSANSDWVYKMLEDNIILYRNIINALRSDSTCKDLISAICLHIKLSTGKSLKSTFANVAQRAYNDFYPLLQEKVNDLFDLIRTTEYGEPQAFESYVDITRLGLDKYSELKKSVLFKKIYKLLMYILSFNIFSKIGITMSALGYSKLEEAAISSKYHLGVDFLHTLVDTITFLIQRGYQTLRTGDIECLFHSRNDYVGVFDMCAKLRVQSTQLHNPDAFDFKECVFRRELDDTCEKLQNILKHSSRLERFDREKMRHIYSDMMLMKTTLVTQSASRESRRCPFSILVYGESGIGKSSVKDLLFHHFGKVKSLPTDSTYLYTRNPVAKFWDGFRTSQWAILMDDIAFMHPNKAPNGDPSCNEFLQVINNVPVVPDQAALEDKGKTPLRPELVIGTTNTIDLNAHYYFSHPSAVQRRFPFIIKPVPKKEYTGEGGMLDSSKVPEVDPYRQQYQDLWVWTVIKVTPNRIGAKDRKANMSIIFEDVDLRTFLVWYGKAIKDFDINQDKVMNSLAVMRDIEVCPMCTLPDYMCECDPQAIVCDSSWLIYIQFCLIYYVCAIIVLTSAYIQRVPLLRYALGRLVDDVVFTLRSKLRSKFNFVYDWRARFGNMGERVQASIGYPVFLSVIAGLLTTTFAIKYLYNMFEVQSSDSKSIGRKPTGNGTEEPTNVWYKNSYQLSTFDITPQITSGAALSRSQFIDQISRNCVSVAILIAKTGEYRKSKAVCLRGSVYLLNNHSVPDIFETTTVDIKIQTSKDGITRNFSMKLCESQVKRYPDKDLCTLDLKSLPPMKGIVHHVPTEHFKGAYNGFYIGRGLDGEISVDNVERISYDGTKYVPRLDLNTQFWACLVKKNTASGDCGSLLVSETKLGRCIVGIHLLGGSGAARAIAINSTMVESFLDDLPFVIQSGEPRLEALTASKQLVDLHPKSPIRYITGGTAEVFGSLTGHRSTPTSRVQVTPMANFLTNYGYRIKFAPPMMKGYQPWRIALLDMVNPVKNIDTDILNKAADGYMKDIMSKLPPNALEMLEVYDNMTAINGAAGVAYVDKMNRNTSAGFPWNKGKRAFMTAIPAVGDLLDPVDVTDEIIDRVDDIITRYHRGEQASPVFSAHLKDEAVSFKKAKMGKTRIFTGAPMDHSIVTRKYYLSAIRLMQTHRVVFETAVGTIAQSTQWGGLHDHLTKFGTERMIAGDYKAFDKRMSPVFILKAFEILINLCKLSGNYNAEDVRVLEGIAIDIAYPLINFNGDLIRFFGSNPSGHALTVIINSLVNSLYMRYAYIDLNPKSECSSFIDNVALLTYGDDNALGVSERVPWYNHTSVQCSFGRLDITYTMADKEAKSVPYISMGDISFLKRHWVYDADVGAILAPLELESIEKQLMIWVESKTISNEQQCVASVTSAVREYFFHGKAVYESKVAILKDMIKDLGLEAWVEDNTFQTFNQLVIEFWNLSGKPQPDV